MPLSPLVGPVCLSLGVIGLALGIHDRITRSVFLRRYLVATYAGRLASRLVRTAPFWRIPFGICLTAAGLALILGHGSFLGVLWLITALTGALAVTGYAWPIAWLKPAWFRREEQNGYPILQTPDVPARRPLFIWIVSIAVFIPLGLALLAESGNSSHLAALILVALGAIALTGAAAAYPKWSQKAGPSRRAPR